MHRSPKGKTAPPAATVATLYLKAGNGDWPTTTAGGHWWWTLPVMRDVPFFPDLRAVAVLSAALPIFRPEKPD